MELLKQLQSAKGESVTSMVTLIIPSGHNL